MRMSSFIQFRWLAPFIELDDESFDTALCSPVELPTGHENHLIIEVDQTWRDPLRSASNLLFWLDLVAKYVSILADVGRPSVNALAVSEEVFAHLHCHKAKEVYSLVAGPVVLLLANIVIKNSVCEAGPRTPDQAKGIKLLNPDWQLIFAEIVTIVSLMS